MLEGRVGDYLSRVEVLKAAVPQPTPFTPSAPPESTAAAASLPSAAPVPSSDEHLCCVCLSLPANCVLAHDDDTGEALAWRVCLDVSVYGRNEPYCGCPVTCANRT